MPEKIPAKVDYLRPLEDKPYSQVVKEKKEYKEKLKKNLSDITGVKNVFDDNETLAKYSKDKSLEQPRKPTFVIYPNSTEEIQKIVKLANQEKIPVIPSSSGVHFYGATIPLEGGIVIDLKVWKKIFKIDPRNRAVRIQPGVTYGELQSELEKNGLRALIPLLPHKEKSVVTAHLEGEPMTITEFNYSEPLYTCEIVLPKGDIFRTGSASSAPPEVSASDLVGPWGPGFDWNRLYCRSQGTLGIITWANIMAEPLPTVQKIFFTPSKDLNSLISFTYGIQHRWLGYECFVLNRANLASILAEDKVAGYAELKKKLPSFIMVHCIAGTKRLPEEKVAWQEQDVMDEAQAQGVYPQTTIPEAPHAKKFFEEHLRRPWPKDIYWKDIPKGASADIFFITTLNRVPGFIKTINEVAECFEYPISDIGIYIQPIENGRAVHLEFNLPYDPNSGTEKELINKLHFEASQRLLDLGGVFTRAYGKWAYMVNNRNAIASKTAKTVKDFLDPNNIMNPGKLGF
ncbi:MAG: hypothetical protein A2149_01225 [Candidatus Schekmanbacteria bacterium RBG_16_38_11]|uniref:D-lactate dehydrogenase (cytochrome) n=1 Tax=Candidatus Schekmanbacteria bacterium RBG_16_38_11 TaxID=1817880 RepID=A0A1F7RXY7_9BACT|nr:MAG: hypothetical protein A2149_01225 [Candidatus Schekmanbacteria bacterium RBG_16_38_11]